MHSCTNMGYIYIMERNTWQGRTGETNLLTGGWLSATYIRNQFGHVRRTPKRGLPTGTRSRLTLVDFKMWSILLMKKPSMLWTKYIWSKNPNGSNSGSRWARRAKSHRKHGVVNIWRCAGSIFSSMFAWCSVSVFGLALLAALACA